MFCLMFLPQKINNKLWRNHTISFKQIIFSKYATNLTPYHIIIHALQTVLHLNKKCFFLMYNYCVYNNIFWIFLIQMECPSAKYVLSYSRANRVSEIPCSLENSHQWQTSIIVTCLRVCFTFWLFHFSLKGWEGV